jgi:hypothetical protein
MSAPVINTTTSVLGFTANTYAAYQAGTTGASVTTWACAGLPPGLAINASSGLISGTPTTPGIYNCLLSATNGDGTGTLAITIGIDGASGLVADPGIEVDFDIVSGAVSFPTSPDGKLHGKSGDYLSLLIGFTKGGIGLPLPVLAISFGVKEYESDALILLSAGAGFTAIGSYQNTRYRTLVYLDPAKLAGPFSDYESDALIGEAAAPAGTDPSQLITVLAMPAEIRVSIAQADTTLTPGTIDRSSQIFALQIERNEAPAP